MVSALNYNVCESMKNLCEWKSLAKRRFCHPFRLLKNSSRNGDREESVAKCLRTKNNGKKVFGNY